MFRTLALFLLLGVVVHAQTPLATVTGLATDPSRLRDFGAAITLTNKDTGAKLSTKSNQAGAYSLPNLPPGSYSLTAEAPDSIRSKLSRLPWAHSGRCARTSSSQSPAWPPMLP